MEEFAAARNREDDARKRIRSGEADRLVTPASGDRVFTLKGVRPSVCVMVESITKVAVTVRSRWQWMLYTQS